MSYCIHQCLGLPFEVLIRVFSNLGQQQLGINSVVCTSWNRAAIVALRQLHLDVNVDNLQSIPHWLKHRAQLLHCLQFTHASQALQIQLPFHSISQLRQLRLSSGLLVENAVAAFAALQHTLTSMKLLSVVTNSRIKLLSSVAALHELRDLDITNLQLASKYIAEDTEEYAAAANSIWINLRHLTALTLWRCQLGDAALREITQLDQLQHLDLANTHIRHFSTLIPLPKDLTHLDICCNSKLDCSPILAYQPLTALQCLNISEITLSSPRQLTAVINVQELWMNETDVSQTDQLLSVLPQLSSLRDLDLTMVFCGGVEARELGNALQLPQLTFLCLKGNFIRAGELDPGVNEQWPATQLFSGCSMPQLRKLSLHNYAEDEPTIQEYVQVEFQCRAQEFQVIADRFPQLLELDLLNRVHRTVRWVCQHRCQGRLLQ